MNKFAIGLIVIVAFVVGGAVGGSAIYKMQSLTANQAQDGKQADSNNSSPRADRPIDKGEGLGLTPTEMLEELQAMPSDREFDRRYLNYIALMRSNENGMARVAVEKATQPELKQAAQEQMTQNQELVSRIYQWVNLWGFTDH
ncbi:MAG: hypothetical protein M3Q36_02930 [bacterium]|nr:hypothetical protein [bacterium]